MSDSRIKGVFLVFVLALVVGTAVRLGVLDGPAITDAPRSSAGTADAQAVSQGADAAAPPGWVRFEAELLEGLIHPDWVVGTIDLNHFVTDEALAHLAPMVRQAMTQQSDLLKDTTVIWIELNIDEGASFIQIHGCFGPSSALGPITPEMMAELYRSLGMRATPAGTFRFGGGRSPVVRINEPPGDSEVLQATLVGKGCYTTAEFFGPTGDAGAMRLFETFIENLRFRD